MIDRARKNDLPTLVALTRATGFFDAEEVQAVGEMFEAAMDAPQAGAEEYTWEVYRDTPDSAALGYTCYGPASFTVGTYELYWIVVAPEQQNKQIGRQLLEAMENNLRARGARQIYIETSDRPLYLPTRAFYERRGYVVAAHFRDFYMPGDGKVIYFKEF